MELEKAKALLSLYPDIFSYFIKKYKHPEYQFSVSNGWYQLIFDICYHIKEVQYKYYKNEIEVTCLQIKEKFGGLSFYYTMYVRSERLGDKISKKISGWFLKFMCKHGFSTLYWKSHNWRCDNLYQTIPEKIELIIKKRVGQSYKICELCGSEGEICNPSGRWTLTLCKKHFNEEKERKEWKAT